MAKKKQKIKKNQQKPLQETVKNQAKWIPYAVAAGIGVLLLALCLVLFHSGPLDKLKKAAGNTFFAENFTAMYSIDVNGDVVDGYVNLAIDPDKRTLDMYMTLETRESDYDCGIYKTTFVVCSAVTNDIYTLDISDRLDNFFDALEKNGNPDWQILLDFSKVNLQKEISKDFDFETFLKCFGSWLNKLNNKNWATKNAGYSVKKEGGTTTHTFHPDPYTLVCETIPMFRSAFRQESRYDQLTEYVDNAKYLFISGKADFSCQVQNGYLTAANFEIKYHNTHIKADFSFIGIGKTIIDTGAVQDYIASAEEEPEE